MPNQSSGFKFPLRDYNDNSLAAIEYYLASWGTNINGQLMNGTRTSSSDANRVTGNQWINCSAGNQISLGIRKDNTLWVAGINNNGQLGLNKSATISYSSPVQVGALTTWSKISATTYVGEYAVLAIQNNGTLWAWGENAGGKLGLNVSATASMSYSSPVQVGALTDWYSVSVSYQLAAAVKTDGTLWTWGSNGFGQLGNGVTNSGVFYSSPIQIGSLTNWADVKCGFNYMIAVKTDGTLWSWGANSVGQLGNNTSSNYSSPVQVGTLTNWSKIAIGGSAVPYALAIKTDGTLWAWGRNTYGELGNNTAGPGIYYSSPIQIGSLTNWAYVSAGGNIESVIATKTDGTLWAWGDNSQQQLPTISSTGAKYSSPIQVGSLNTWSSISMGYDHALLNDSATVNNVDMADMFVRKELFLDAGMWSWGYNANGELANRTISNYSSPVQIGSLTTWKQINLLSWYHGLAIKTDGTIWSWGQNQYGQLGTGTVGVSRSSPVQIGALNNWKQVSGNYAITAIKTDGTLWSWGWAYDGGLGNNRQGIDLYYSSPVQIGSLTNWKQISSNNSTSIAIKTDGTLWAWGSNGSGQLGNNTAVSYSSPIQIGSLTNWKQISTGSSGHAAAIKTDGTLWTWGRNAEGQLGNNTIGNNYSSPVQIGTLTTWKQICCGYRTTYAINNNGTLWAWGRNESGELGNGFGATNLCYSSPVQIGSLTNWKQLSGGFHMASAIKTDGTLWAWGRNEYGQLGNQTTIYYSSPIQVGSLTNWKQVSCGILQMWAIQSPDLP